ncbi:reverse transcriptase domain-containing protein [Tanacetum coccineum]
MAPRGRPTRLNPGTTPPPVADPTTTTSVTSAQLQAMIDEGVTAVLAARATTRNGDDSHTSGTGVRRNERAVRECTYQDFMKCQPLFFRGTEGVVDLTQWFERMETVFHISNCTMDNQVKFATCTLIGIALTWWNSHARTVTNEVAYAMTWSDLKKKMTTKYCPRNEIKKIEAELWNLKVKGTDVVAYNQRFQELALLCDRMFPEETDKIERYVGGMPDLIYSSVVASKPKTMQEAIEMATELMDRRNNTFAERQAENKRKFEDTPRNNQNQQPNKRQNTGRAYAAGNGDKKSYEGTKPLCPKPLQEGPTQWKNKEPGKIGNACSPGLMQWSLPGQNPTTNVVTELTMTTRLNCYTTSIKSVTIYFPNTHHVIASSESRNSLKNMSRFSSNDMVHNHYLEEAMKKTQERGRNSRPSVMPSARSQSTTNGSKPKPKINNQKSRNWPTSKTCYVTTKTLPIAEHSRNSRNFSDSKHFVCSTCQKCIFDANHDSCVTKFLNEVNSHAKVPSNKTTNKNKPVEQTSFAKNQKDRSQKDIVGLRWVPIGKIFTSSTTKVDSEPTNGSNEDITNKYECKQTLDVSAGTLNLSAGTSFNPKKEGLRVCSELGIHDHRNEPSSSKLVSKVVPPADKTATSRQELELLFHPSHNNAEMDEYKGIMPTKIELTLEQSQQGVSNDVLVRIEGVEELKRNVWIKGVKKEALHTP